MQKISTSVIRLPIHFLRSGYIGKDMVSFEDTCGVCERIFSSPVPVCYTCHNDHFVTVWKILLLFGLYDAFQGYWNHVVMILLVVVIPIFVFEIEEFMIQLEEPFSIFPTHGFCNMIYDSSHEIIGWDPNKVKKNVDS